MKLNKLAIALSAVVALGVVGCSSDGVKKDPVDQPGGQGGNSATDAALKKLQDELAQAKKDAADAAAAAKKAADADKAAAAKAKDEADKKLAELQKQLEDLKNPPKPVNPNPGTDVDAPTSGDVDEEGNVGAASTGGDFDKKRTIGSQWYVRGHKSDFDTTNNKVPNDATSLVSNYIDLKNYNNIVVGRSSAKRNDNRITYYIGDRFSQEINKESLQNLNFSDWGAEASVSSFHIGSGNHVKSYWSISGFRVNNLMKSDDHKNAAISAYKTGLVHLIGTVTSGGQAYKGYALGEEGKHLGDETNAGSISNFKTSRIFGAEAFTSHNRVLAGVFDGGVNKCAVDGQLAEYCDANYTLANSSDEKPWRMAVNSTWFPLIEIVNKEKVDKEILVLSAANVSSYNANVGAGFEGDFLMVSGQKADAPEEYYGTLEYHVNRLLGRTDGLALRHVQYGRVAAELKQLSKAETNGQQTQNKSDFDHYVFQIKVGGQETISGSGIRRTNFAYDPAWLLDNRKASKIVDNFFYRGKCETGDTSSTVGSNSCDLAGNTGPMPTKGTYFYAGHAITYGLDNRFHGSQAGQNPDSNGLDADEDTSGETGFGNYVEATLDLDKKKLTGEVYNVWRKRTKENLAPVQRDTLVNFEGDVKQNSALGTATIAYDPNAAPGEFRGTFYGENAVELGGSFNDIVSNKDYTGKYGQAAWGGVFGAKQLNPETKSDDGFETEFNKDGK